jgi:hypothetical protein
VVSEIFIVAFRELAIFRLMFSESPGNVARLAAAASKPPLLGKIPASNPSDVAVPSEQLTEFENTRKFPEVWSSTSVWSSIEPVAGHVMVGIDTWTPKAVAVPVIPAI